MEPDSASIGIINCAILIPRVRMSHNLFNQLISRELYLIPECLSIGFLSRVMAILNFSFSTALQEIETRAHCFPR